MLISAVQPSKSVIDILLVLFNCSNRKLIMIPNYSLLGFPCSSTGKESACNAGDLSLIPGLGRCPGERKSYPLQYSGLKNSKHCIVHGIAKSQTRLSDFHFHYSISLLYFTTLFQPHSSLIFTLSYLLHHIGNITTYLMHMIECVGKVEISLFTDVEYLWLD